MNELSLVLPDPLWHPSAVAARAQFFGLPSANVEESRVLEVDCADGGNILSIAASLPGAQCIGVTASAEALQRGQNLVSESSLGNVTLCEEGAGIGGPFDYIFLRNLFSRTEPDKRGELIAHYRGLLSETGILIVDQLCLPGWYFLKGIREQIQYHTRNIDDPQEKMVAARRFLSALPQSIPASMEQYRNIAQSAMDTSKGIPDINFGIEYFDEHRFPSYFHEFDAAVSGSGLQYLCELSLGSMLINQVPAALGSILPENASVAETEQYLDFITNRTRRVSLLVNDQFEIQRNIDPSACRDLYFSAVGQPENPEEVFQEEETILNGPYGSSITVNSQAAKAAMLALTSRFPKRLSFSEVTDIVRDALSEFTEADESSILETFVGCAITEIVRLDSIPGRARFQVSDHPVVSALARAQAKAGDMPYVSSLQHNTVPIDYASAELLARLDGSAGREQLIDRIKELIADGTLSIEKEGEPIDDPEAIAQAAGEQVDSRLAMFVANGLLEA